MSQTIYIINSLLCSLNFKNILVSNIEIGQELIKENYIQYTQLIIINYKNSSASEKPKKKN
jgi:hypothetical protein